METNCGQISSIDLSTKTVAAEDAVAGNEGPGAELKILVVDDSKLNRKLMITMLLRMEGIEKRQLHEARDGQEALDMVVSSYKEDDPFSVVLLDIKMPKMDGLSCLEGLRLYEQGKNIPAGLKVIMVSALGDTRHVDSAFNLGCDHFLTKPVHLDQLKTAFQEHGLRFQSWVDFLKRSAVS